MKTNIHFWSYLT